MSSSVVRLGLCVALAVEACVPPTTEPETPFTAVAPPSGSPLHAYPSERTLSVSARGPVLVFSEEGAERVSAVSIAGATIDDPTIASIEGEEVVAHAAGKTTMHVAANATSTVDVPIVVVDAAPVALSIRVAPNGRVGERIPVRAIATWSDGTVGDATWDASWSTDTEARVLVSDALDARGAVVALEPKPGRVIARLGELVAASEIAPVAGAPVGIEVKLAWSSGELRRFGAIARYADGEVRDVSAGCLWRIPDRPPFRGLERAQPGPLVKLEELAWDRTATCELAGTSGSGALFGP